MAKEVSICIPFFNKYSSLCELDAGDKELIIHTPFKKNGTVTLVLYTTLGYNHMLPLDPEAGTSFKTTVENCYAYRFVRWPLGRKVTLRVEHR